MNQANSDIDYAGIQNGVAQLIGAVIGTSIEPDKTRLLSNGRMNRPENRGGEGVEWLNTENGQFWLSLADQVGIDTAVIRKIADNPNAFGYDDIGNGNWDMYGNGPNEGDNSYNEAYSTSDIRV